MSNPRKIRIVRAETSPQGTFGELYIDDEFFCYTGELPRYAGNENIENERSTDCIPAGTYLAKLGYSPRFKRDLYELHVPNRSYIKIHAGNFCGQKPYKSDVEGCIILGEEVNEIGTQRAVTKSSITLNKFMKRVNGSDLSIEIEWL